MIFICELHGPTGLLLDDEQEGPGRPKEQGKPLKASDRWRAIRQDQATGVYSPTRLSKIRLFSRSSLQIAA
jgi:hypothetical protein